MRPDAFIVLMELIIITGISGMLVHQFIMAKNGKLRILMIIFWACQGWATLWSAFHFWFIINYGWDLVNAIVSRLMSLTPVTISMVLILIHVIKLNKK